MHNVATFTKTNTADKHRALCENRLLTAVGFREGKT